LRAIPSAIATGPVARLAAGMEHALGIQPKGPRFHRPQRGMTCFVMARNFLEENTNRWRFGGVWLLG
jgi:hypothetical protein